ncbi:coatomer epsilon subunit-domain-containing protein [Protomyces lactucae-debilis]|uniref:Coatomer subunit epsilon n=1 Tax=Protomyces lactucae-debilis TaxID=2754530 RepID=A0A1Y2FR99_PROLT|nr:coatomer epsilon subunit-domain-containing protein [Protomyces lactucae-debilis]ORY85726.1 coatomer epsilon subunit-domain-containing protein [Protomyces lactucae-debilis]
MSQDPLYNEKNLFYRGDYKAVIAEQEKPGIAPLVLRAQIELDPTAALQQLKTSKDAHSKACAALCHAKLGHSQEAEKGVDGLLTSTEPHVQVVVATVLARLERYEEALDVLGSLDENIEASALQIHIHLALDQLSQAEGVLKNTQQWCNDEELVQLAEAWIMMRQGGDRLNAASYTFEELAEMSPSAVRMQVAKAAAALASGDTDDALAQMKRALQRDTKQADALANRVVLAAIQGEDRTEAKAALKDADANHPLLKDLEEKEALFGQLAGQYTFVEAV